MRKWFRRAKLKQQLVLVSCLFLLIPMLLLCYTSLRSLLDTAVQTRIREAQARCEQAVTQAERVAELCNLSTQVFLNTPALVNHLSLLKQGQEPTPLELMDFYRQDIASLEKIIISNPDLYQIRVYAQAEDISEMMPILYSAQRMQRMPWAQEEPVSGVWHLDFDDQLFPDYPVTQHVMSLVTSITTTEQGQVGVLEVSVLMEQLLPDLFEDTGNDWAVLLDEDGCVLTGPDRSDTGLDGFPFSESPTQIRLDGKPVLITQARLKDYDCIYLQVTDLSDIYGAAVRQAILLLAVLLTAAILMVYAISYLTRRILRGFYGAFDGIRAFADGDIDAAVEVTGEGEVADFAREAGGLLDKIRQLMRDNLNQETQAQRSEIRALQNQINAHFIYNVLEAIKMMAEIDEKYEIADAVTTLGKLLRYSMKLEGGCVRLEQELDYIENYVALMNLRFDYVISLNRDIPPELLGQSIPKISLQPIVENAVVHGAAALAADSTIVLRGSVDREENRFSIQIIDEGRGMDEEGMSHLRRQISGEEPTRSSSGNGIGLKNVQDRIRMSFGEDYGLQVASQPGVGTTVTVTLPYREKEEGNA